MTAVNDLVSGEKDLARPQQDQRAQADAVATLANRSCPRIGRGVEVPRRVTGKLVSVGKHVPITEQRSRVASDACDAVVKRSSFCLLCSGGIVNNAPAPDHQYFAAG